MRTLDVTPKHDGLAVNLDVAQQLLELSKGLLTPLIAIIAVYVAWQQWQLNKRKMKLELYDRRKAVYEELKKLFGIISRDATVNMRDLSTYWVNVSEADFLFGSDVTRYLKQIYDHGVKLSHWNRQYKDYTQTKPPGYDHDKVVEGMHSELEWLMKQGEPAMEKFKKYLNLQ